MSQDLKALYDNNADFKRYVDKCCANDGYHKTATLETVLSRAITREVAKMYQTNTEKPVRNTQSTFTPQGECV
ncbi:MAG: hypothetical protein OSJ60_08900 [Lachnospiraceae bacterium]|nr:hypothetical protein [Lachnospiraceae bacterium]